MPLYSTQDAPRESEPGEVCPEHLHGERILRELRRRDLCTPCAFSMTSQPPDGQLFIGLGDDLPEPLFDNRAQEPTGIACGNAAGMGNGGKEGGAVCRVLPRNPWWMTSSNRARLRAVLVRSSSTM
jgi:hypothetical protein